MQQLPPGFVLDNQPPAASPQATPQPLIRPQPAPPTELQLRADQRAEQASRLALERAERERAREEREARMGYRNTRQLPETAINRLSEGATGLMNLDRAIQGFQDDYAGNAITGGLENTIQQRFSGFGTPGQQQWWADVAATDNVLRHALFGASLTAGEQAAWDRTTVTPSMDPALVRQNLERRRDIARDVLRRHARTYRANGFNPDAVRESLGELGSLLDDQPALQTQPEQRRDINGNVIPTLQPGETVAFTGDATPPPDATNPWTPEQQEAYDAFNRANPRATADEIRAFARSVGIRDISNAEDIVRARDAGGGVAPGSRASRGAPGTPEARSTNYELNYTPIPGGPTISANTQAIDAAVRGAADVGSLGFADEIAAVGDTVFNGGTYGENLWRQRGIDQYDTQNNFAARTAGQAAGGVALPSGVGRAAFGGARRALAEGATREAARGAAVTAGARRLGLEGLAFGGAYGAGSSDGSFTDRLASGGISALIGGSAGYGLGRGIGGLLARGRGGGANAGGGAVEARRAADDLGMDLMPADVSGPFIRRATGVAAQLPFSTSRVIGGVERTVEQGRVARDRIAGEIGTALDPEAAGQAATQGARTYRTESRDRVGRAYDTAADLAGDARIDPANARAILDRNIAELSESPIGPPQALIDLRQRLEGDFTVQGLRDLRTQLRDQFAVNGLRGSDTERRGMMAVDALTEDIATGLTQQGRTEAAQAYRAADQMHRERVDMIDNVLIPIIGRNGERSGEQVVRALDQAMRGNADRARRFIGSLPSEEQGNVRATLITQLGRSSNGQQNAAGDNFSLDRFLTNWNAMTPSARTSVFGESASRSLTQLARVAQQRREVGQYANRSNTGSVIGATATGGTLAIDWMALGAAALAQYGAGRLLSSPVFARWLAREPGNAAQARAHINQLSRIARTQPAISSEVLGVQQAMLRGLERPLAASEPNEQQ